MSKKPAIYRTLDGRVFQNGCQLKLHNGFWWWDVGCPIAPKGAEKNLPTYDEEKDEVISGLKITIDKNKKCIEIDTGCYSLGDVLEALKSGGNVLPKTEDECQLGEELQKITTELLKDDTLHYVNRTVAR